MALWDIRGLYGPKFSMSQEAGRGAHQGPRSLGRLQPEDSLRATL